VSYRLVFYVILPCFLFLFVSPQETRGQVMPEEYGLGVETSVIPVAGYSSDYGLFGGGYVQRINYGIMVRPFVSNTAIRFTMSTKGNIISKVDYERTTTFGTDIRSRLLFDGLRLLSTTYFGIGNESEFSSVNYEDDIYFFEERTLSLQYWGRKNLREFDNEAILDGQLLLSASYSNPVSRGSETLLNNDQPRGFGGGWVNKAGIGLIVDHRDSEFNPTIGYRFEANASAAGTLTGSEYNFTSYYLEARGYYSPVRDVVIAQKLEFQHAAGDIPFWELPVIGNELGLRGYPLNRFRDTSALLHIIELRTWLFGILDNQIRFGAQAFMDTGRVLSSDNRFTDISRDLKQTYGFGGAISLLNPDFIFRGDIAFSEDLYRIYLTVGYLF
jgi:outer membrane protein assembly factor BamA